MSKSDTFESDMLKLVFQNIAIALIGDASGLQPSGAAGNLYLSLHSADPGETGDQTTNEVAYPGYARQAVVRSASGWTISGTAPTQSANAAIITFPACTVGAGEPVTATYAAIGTALSGAGKRLYSGAITSPAAGLVINPGISPNIAIGAAVFTED